MWSAYVLIGVSGLIGSSACLHGSGWLAEFDEKFDSARRIQEDGGSSGLVVTNVYIVDLLLEFFGDAVENWASIGVFLSLVMLATTVTFNLVAEASRRRSRVPQVAVAFFYFLIQVIGACFVIPMFLALLNLKQSKPLPPILPKHDLDLVRSATIVLCSLITLGLGLFGVPLSSVAWPGGPVNNTVVGCLLFLPCVPCFGFLFDATSNGTFETDPSKLNSSTSSIADRELAHYLIMGNCGLNALFGLFVHWKCLYIFLFHYGASFSSFLNDATINGPCAFLLVDLIAVFLAAYVWLQFEAIKPIKRTGRLLSWRDGLALLLFGPSCHFSLAFASREYGLLRLDNLATKEH